MDFNTQKIKALKVNKENLFSRFFKTKFTEKEDISKVTIENNYDNELLENLRQAKSEWEDANMNFNYVDDMEIVDYYTYKILASQIRYEYFIKKAKERGIGEELNII